MTFETELGRSGQIKLHLKWLEATFCVAADLRSLTLLATFAAKDEQQDQLAELFVKYGVILRRTKCAFLGLVSFPAKRVSFT